MSVTDKKSGSEPNTVYVKSAIYLKCISCLILLQLNSSYAATPPDEPQPDGVKQKFLHLLRPDNAASTADTPRSAQKIVVSEPIEGPKFTYIAPPTTLAVAETAPPAMQPSSALKKTLWPWSKQNDAHVAKVLSTAAQVQTQPLPDDAALQVQKRSLPPVMSAKVDPLQNIQKPTLSAVIRPATATTTTTASTSNTINTSQARTKGHVANLISKQ